MHDPYAQARGRALRDDGADTVLVHMLREWGRQWLRLRQAGFRFPDGSWHVDGWPSISVSGRIARQAEGASQVRHQQQYLEVYRGDALFVRRAMEGIREYPRHVIVLRYALRQSDRSAVKILHLRRDEHAILMADAHGYLRGRIEAMEKAEAI